MATICWASTSSGLRGTRVSSMSPRSIRPAVTAATTRSPRNLGKILPSDGCPTWWPARPMRCSPLATDGGASTCTTRSMAPMSMPSSRLDVATSAGSLPAFNWSSISSRCSRAIDPWWARTSSSPASSLRRAASRSARRREFTKISVDVCDRMRSRRTGWMAGQIEWRTSGSPAAGPDSTSGMTLPSSPMSSTGTMTSSSSCLRTPASTTLTGRAAHSPVVGSRWRPPRNRATSSSGRWVADSPMRCGRTVSVEPLQPLQRQRQVGAPLGGRHGVDLVDDHVLDRPRGPRGPPT